MYGSNIKTLLSVMYICRDPNNDRVLLSGLHVSVHKLCITFYIGICTHKTAHMFAHRTLISHSINT